MNLLIELTKKIKDKELREKVVKVLEDQELSSQDFKKYKREKLERAGSVFGISSSSMGPVERDIINHTVQVTEMVLETAKIFEKNYKIELNVDAMVAAAILHDIMKAFEFRRDEDDDLVPTGIMIDHTMIITAELYHRNFPEDVIHLVASHGGEAGTTTPRSFEAVILHHIDAMCSVVEYYILSKKKMQEKLMALRAQELLKLHENRGD